MKLTGKQIVEQGLLITNGKGKEAQVGYDVTVCEITAIQQGQIGFEKKDNYIEDYLPLTLEDENTEKPYWILAAGVYSLTFEQGVKLDNRHAGHFVHRSSVLRSSGLITSGVFDPGFECDQAGATLFVMHRMVIYKGARVAQFVCEETFPVEKEALYNGSYQKDKDLK